MAQIDPKPMEHLHEVALQLQFIQDLISADGSPHTIEISEAGVDGFYFFLDDLKDAIMAAYDTFDHRDPNPVPDKEV